MAVREYSSARWQPAAEQSRRVATDRSSFAPRGKPLGVQRRPGWRRTKQKRSPKWRRTCPALFSRSGKRRSPPPGSPLLRCRSGSRTSVELPDKTVQQGREPSEVGQMTRQPEIYVGQQNEIGEDEEIIQREKHEANRGPQQKPGAVAEIASNQQPSACQAGREAQQINGGRHLVSPFSDGMHRRESAVCVVEHSRSQKRLPP